VVFWVKTLWEDTDISEQYATSIFRVVVCRFRNMIGYVGKLQGRRSYPRTACKQRNLFPATDKMVYHQRWEWNSKRDLMLFSKSGNMQWQVSLKWYLLTRLWCHNLEDSNINSHHYEHVKTDFFMYVSPAPPTQT
jgi:hypothetical protein